MITKTLQKTVITAAGCALVFSSMATMISAQSVTPGARRAAKEGQQETKLKTRGDSEIAKRIASLNTAITKVQEAKKLTEAQKSSLVGTYQSAINNLNSLKTKIDADTDAATLKTDVVSITQGYRIYMLVLPQSAIVAAADRILDVTADMNGLVEKLQTRITQAQQANHDVTALQKSLDDMKAKIADAQTQVQNALSGVTGLTPDQGDKAKMDSNTQAIKSSRGLIKTAEQDIKTARTDAQSIVSGLKAFK